MDIIMYGIGMGLDLAENSLKKEHHIVGYMDSFSKIKSFRGKKFYSPGDITGGIQFDYIVITIKSRKTSWRVYNTLTHDYGISTEKIVIYYIHERREQYKSKLSACGAEKIKALIFGNSHAAFGYMEEEFSIPVKNLALPSADIYYNYHTFMKCREEYGEVLEEVDCVIIDLFNYNVFNLDTSKSPHVFDYIRFGGLVDEHNFRDNKNFDKPFQEELRQRFLTKHNGEIRTHLFDSIVTDSMAMEETYLEPMNRWKYVEKNIRLPHELIISNTILKKNKAIIEDNIHLLEKFIRAIRNMNPRINIVFTLIPRYASMEALQRPFIVDWKDDFYEIMQRLSNQYNACFFDYKLRKELSENNYFYYDVEHLNTVGGRVLTSMLNEDLIDMSII